MHTIHLKHSRIFRNKSESCRYSLIKSFNDVTNTDIAQGPNFLPFRPTNLLIAFKSNSNANMAYLFVMILMWIMPKITILVLSATVPDYSCNLQTAKRLV
jgi:hypothetical protein